jgi:hypothetical protein
MKNDEFYIGWMAHAPASFSRFTKNYLAILLSLVIALGLVLALSQKKPDNGSFEFGKLTAVKGFYFNQPVPLLKVVNGNDIRGNYLYITILLVGYGKHGAEDIIAGLEKEKNMSLDKKEITLKGTLVYNDGKLIMQVAENDKPLLNVANTIIPPTLLPQLKELGTQTIKGEIVDPKCYFGVMKPGQGKPHRDCAIRCISGGIPPVMRVQNEKGEANYYLIVGPNGEKMNEAVQGFVAEPTEIEARVVQYDDWIVLYVKNKETIHRISYLSLTKDHAEAIACSTTRPN